jgi:hypothetical protein
VYDACVRSYLVTSVFLLAAGCSTFEAGDDTGDGGVSVPPDAGTDAPGAPDAPGDAAFCATPPCIATEVADELPSAMGASGDVVAWAAKGGIHASVAGAARVVVLANTTAPVSGDVAVRETFVFWAESNGVRRCKIGDVCDGVDGPAAPIYGLSSATSVALAGADLYAVESSGAFRVVTCPATGCGTSFRTIASLPAKPRFIVATTTRVIVGLETGAIDSYAVAASASDAGVPAEHLATASALTGLASDGTSLYWGDGSMLFRCVLGPSCAPTALVTGLAGLGAIAVDASRVYWLEAERGRVAGCAIDACAATTLATVAQPALLAVTRDRIYFASLTTQKLYSLPK